MYDDDSSAELPFWLGQLESLLCERFRELGHQYAQIRGEIAAHVGNVVADSAEREEWDVCKFMWLMLREWQDNGLTNKVFPQEPPPQLRYPIEVGRIESLRHLPTESCFGPWDHACLCAGELCNTIRSVANLPPVSFKAVLSLEGVQPPAGDAPAGRASQSSVESPLLVEGDFVSWSDYMVRLECEVIRARKAITAVNKQNMEMACRLSEAQNELCDLRKSRGYYPS